MANKYIKDLTGTTNPSLTGFTIFDDGVTTYKTTLETLKNTIVDGVSHTFQGNQTINGNLIVTGSITAKEYIVSSSVTNVTTLAQSGSTVFGDTLNDTHRMTGSVLVTGSLNVQGGGQIKDYLFVSGFQVIGTPTHQTGSNAEKLHVGTYGSYNIAHFQGDDNNYTQVNIKNINSGSTASTDLVLTANNGTEENYYVNVGINSSTYTAGQVGDANDGYIINKGSDLYIGSLSGSIGHNNVHVYTAGNWRAPAISVFDNHAIGFNTQTLGPSDKYAFSGNTTFKNDVRVTGSLNVQGGGQIKDYLFVSGFQVIGTPTHHTGANAEKLHVGTYDSYNIAHFQGNHNTYAQVNVKNISGAAGASSDFVATADNGTEELHYVNMGINSSGFNTPFSVGYQNDAYVINRGRDLYIGSLDGPDYNHTHVHLFSSNSWQDPQISIISDKKIGFNTGSVTSGYTYEFSGSAKFKNDLNVNGNVVIGTGIGEEGGEMMLVKPITNTNISGSGVIIDSYRDRVRIFEQGGSTRGAFLDITKQSNAVGSQIVTSPNLFSIQTITSASYAALTPVSGTLYIIID
jgi:hypothetical protein